MVDPITKWTGASLCSLHFLGVVERGERIEKRQGAMFGYVTVL